jgi:hypothetical protein
MHATDATRPEHADPGLMGDDHRCGNRGRRVLAPRHGDRQVAPAALAHAAKRTRREPLDFNRRHPDGNGAAEHRDSRWNSAGLAHRLFHRQCGVGIRRPRQAVRDQR